MEDLGLAVICAAVIMCASVLDLTDTGRPALWVPGTDTRITVPESCPSKLLWGLPCPGCGLTRSFVAMSRGEVLRAHSFNAVGPVLFVLCVLQVPYRVWRAWGLGSAGPRRERLDDTARPVLWTVLIALLVTWMLNIVSEAVCSTRYCL
ncbi:MAG: DUF2752 domain-containing protein [Thermodesulfobacteriota bacterium]